MSSFSSQFNPRANVFLIVNLGCEMLYVIDQRLKAQQIDKQKATEVYHEITSVLLEPKFIDSLIQGSRHELSELLTVEHCRGMLNDIATCSLMRLDEASMDKLWNLMTMVYKWQLFVTLHPHQLLDITFRHLDSVGKLYPDVKRSILVDYTKNTLLDFWNACGDETQLSIYRTNKAWLVCFHTKISLLIRLGFQALDGSFFRNVDESFFQEFVDSAGENIYTKSAEIAAQRRQELGIELAGRRNVDQLAEMLGATPSKPSESGEDDLKPMDAGRLQKQLEQQLQQCNILFGDLDVKGEGTESAAEPQSNTRMSLFPDIATTSSCSTGTSRQQKQGEFVKLQPIYNRNAETSSGAMGGKLGGGMGVNRKLLERYSKMN